MKEGFSNSDINNLKEKELVYVKGFNRFKNDKKEYEYIISEIRKYNFESFKTEDTGYCFNIYPDSEFLNLISKLNQHIDNEISLNKIVIFITKENDNEINLDTSLPEILKGSSIGYKIYKLTIKKYGYISSDRRSSDDAKNLWYNLLQDDDLLCVTSNYFSYAIDKSIDNDKLSLILMGVKIREEVPIYKVYFDDDLLMKINQIFGSLEEFSR